MVVLRVTIQVKPEHVEEFLRIAAFDAERSEKDEPGCLRFDVIRDRDDPNRIYSYEIYRDEAAFEAHRQTPLRKKRYSGGRGLALIRARGACLSLFVGIQDRETVWPGYD